MSLSNLLTRFRKSGPSGLELAEKMILIEHAKDAYYNKGDNFMTDAEYDILEESAIEQGAIVGIGAATAAADNVKTAEDVELPFPAPSLNKLKNMDDVAKWCVKYPGKVMVSCKLDGASLIYHYVDGKATLYSRGDGIMGKNVTRILQYLKGIPTPGLDTNVCIRGELIMRKDIFQTKYATRYANIRNMISSMMTKKHPIPEILADVDFVVYELIYINAVDGTRFKPSDQFAYLKSAGWKHIVWHNLTTISGNGASGAAADTNLSELFVDKRENYDYEIDGIVVYHDKVHPQPKPGKNPSHAFAYKMVHLDQQAEVTVTGVSWSVSKDGYLKPTIHYVPVLLKGVQCASTTGFNARFIVDNVIGVGAIIAIRRSGDVIPYLEEVITPAVIAAVPDADVVGAYGWNKTEVDFVLNDLGASTKVCANRILFFFKKLETPCLADAMVTKLVQSGYTDVPAILAMTMADWLKIKSVKETMANKMITGIAESIKNADTLKIMAASTLFGRGVGEEVIAKIMEHHSAAGKGTGTINTLMQILQTPNALGVLTGIHGIGNANATRFLAGITPFIEFVNKSPILVAKFANVFPTPAPDNTHKANGLGSDSVVSIVMSGFRDKEFAAWCKQHGVNIVENVKKSVKNVIVSDKTAVTGKTQKANELGIPILTIAEFKAATLG
jgi:NAD-dependent DNA ligase